MKYLRGSVVPLAELRLGSTLVLVSSSVKSRCLVPCMWSNATRLRQGFRREEGESLPPLPCSAPLCSLLPCLPALLLLPLLLRQQQPRARACMTSVGGVVSGCALLIGRGRTSGRSPRRGKLGYGSEPLTEEVRVSLVTVFFFVVVASVHTLAVETRHMF